MNQRHFNALRPVCPACRAGSGRDHALKIAQVCREDGPHVLEGILQCPDGDCLGEFPIIDGIPILVPDPLTYVAEHVFPVIARDDLSIEIENMIGECCGPGSFMDAGRRHLSSYTWDHYGEFDPRESQVDPAPGSVARALERGVATLDRPLTGPLLDAGCAVGRSSFDLAHLADDLVLGVDIDFNMLRLAAGALRRGRVSYPRRSAGLLYERRDFPVEFEHRGQVDFWACDAAALPFASDTFGTAVGLNLLDCVASPLDLLRTFGRVLRPGGQVMLTTPFDWSGAVTAPPAWIGGHSPRAPGRGEGEAVLRALLTPGAHVASVPGLTIGARIDDVPWHVRLHDRSVMTYRLHLVTATATGEAVAAAPSDAPARESAPPP